MALSKQMMDFRDALDSGEPGRILRAIKFNPALALLHETGPGGYVTALDLAMNAGNVAAVKLLLAEGAPMNLPVGPASRFGHIGNTSLSKVLDAPAIAAMPNHRAIFMEMLHAQQARAAEHARLPLLSRLRADADKVWDKLSHAAAHGIESLKEGPGVPKLVTAIGDKAVTSSIIEIPLAAMTQRLTPLSGMLALSAMAAGALISKEGVKMGAKRSMKRRASGFAHEVEEAFEVKQHQAEKAFEELNEATMELMDAVIGHARDGDVLPKPGWRNQRYTIDHEAAVETGDEEDSALHDYPGKSSYPGKLLTG